MTRILRTMREQAERFGINRKTLKAICDRGEIRFVLVGKRTRKFTEEDEREYLEKRNISIPA